MKNQFTPRLFFDPFSMALGATTSGLQSLGGLIQTIAGSRQAKRATKELENLQSPTYTPNQSILDYYNKALSRYNVSPTDSAMYKNQQKNIGRNVAGAVSGLQDRKSALGGISSILRYANDASLNSEVAAEQERSQRFNQLGGATEMKAGEDRTAFDVNQMQPYQRKWGLLAQKASGGNQIMNAGLNNVFGGLQSLGNMSMINKMYPTPKK